MNCKSFKNKNLQLRHAEFILKTGNKSSFIDWNLLRSCFFYCSDQILKGLWYVLSGSDGLARKDNFRFKTQVSFFLVWSRAAKMYTMALFYQTTVGWGWPTACFVDTTIFLISEVHEQVHVGQPTSFYYLRWLSLFWCKHTIARTLFKTKI